MKRENYSHAIADKYKEEKRKAAERRMELRKQRSNKQQLAKLDAGNNIATKERARLLKQK